MGALFLIVCLISLALVLAWNFHKPFRDYMKGKSTIIESIMWGGLYVFDQISQGLQEAVKAGWVPKELIPLLPAIFFAWVIAKRFQTKSPAGKRL